jgi:predicted nucleic acid-binding protein
LIVVDASALAEFLIGTGELGRRVRATILDEELAVPQGAHLEAVSVLRGMLLGGKLPETEADRAVEVLQTMALDVCDLDLLLSRIWGLRRNASPYDAAYVALAELLDVPLVTCDAKLARIPGIRCDVQVLA